MANTTYSTQSRSSQVGYVRNSTTVKKLGSCRYLGQMAEALNEATDIVDAEPAGLTMVVFADGMSEASSVPYRWAIGADGLGHVTMIKGFGGQTAKMEELKKGTVSLNFPSFPTD